MSAVVDRNDRHFLNTSMRVVAASGLMALHDNLGLIHGAPNLDHIVCDDDERFPKWISFSQTRFHAHKKCPLPRIPREYFSIGQWESDTESLFQVGKIGYCEEVYATLVNKLKFWVRGKFSYSV